jgi:hypothetical protein
MLTGSQNYLIKPKALIPIGSFPKCKRRGVQLRSCTVRSIFSMEMVFQIFLLQIHVNSI